ncbi:fibrinogen C domain-containing protein 1-like [Pomacea canaliculata]|nr:fibrinogen C domain-containing protein 1-like [Pomacea canaliculata]
MNGWLQSSGVHVIRPTDSVSFPVFCIAEGHVVFLRRLNNRVNFTRPWRDYRDGFGDISGSHWLGLEKMHILTSQDRVYQLRVQIALTNGTNIYTFYNNFTVRDGSQFYQFDFTVNAMANDCLSDLRRISFSTYDSDNDGDSSVNCASRHSGGWWFRGNTCSTCNPTGQLLQPANGLRTGVDSEVFWIKDLGDVVPFRIRFSLANM